MAQNRARSHAQRGRGHNTHKYRVPVWSAVVLACLTFATPALAFEDLTPTERAAFSLRQLRSDLMVAALSCNLRDEYNAAVTKFQPELVRHGRALQEVFARTYGRKGQTELNRFVTRLANESSARRIEAGVGYCEAATARFDRVLGLELGELAAYSESEVVVAALPLPEEAPRPKLEIREATIAR